jgi:hypothetical protein
MDTDDAARDLAEAWESLRASISRNIETSTKLLESEEAFQSDLQRCFDLLAAGPELERRDASEQFVKDLDEVIAKRLPLLAHSMTATGRRLALASPFDPTLDLAPSLEALAARSKSCAMLIALRHAITLAWEG